MKKYHTITDIVSAVYCEQKLYFDRSGGDVRPADVQLKAMLGTLEHLRFEVEGRSKAALDARCFIATEIYGPQAMQTHYLRLWRDGVLSKRKTGRMLIRLYYCISPLCIPLLQRSMPLRLATRWLLDRVLASLWGRRGQPH